MCDFDGEDAQVQSSTMRRARKQHACVACPDTIEPGHRYSATSQLFDGSWSDYKHCLRCWAMLNAIMAANPGSYIQWDLGCGYSWQDTFGKDPPPEVAALAFALPGEIAA